MIDQARLWSLQQLKKLPHFQARRCEIVARYQAAFGALAELEVPTEHTDVESAWHLYNLRLNLDRWTIHRAQFIEELKALNIGASVHFIPVHMHPYYANKYGYQHADFPVAQREYMRLVSLPLHPRLSDQDVTDVIEAVTGLVEKYRR